VWGYALAVVEDPVEPRLLFLGTEFGLYLSVDGGENWSKWTQGFPTVSTMDLAIHPTESDLVIGTFGRSIYVLDDLRPLRALAREGTGLLSRRLKVFEIPDARLVEEKTPAGIIFPGAAEYSGTNRPAGARITFLTNRENGKEGKGSVANPARSDSVTVEILDSAGTLLRTLRAHAEQGFNRFTWDLRRKGVRSVLQDRRRGGDQEPPGPSVLPGGYTVRITSGGERDSARVTVLGDPRLGIASSAMAAKNAMRLRVLALTSALNGAAERLREAKTAAERIRELEKRDDDTASVVARAGKEVLESIAALMGALTEPEAQGIRSNPDLLPARVGKASAYLRSSWEGPNKTEVSVLDSAEEGVRAFLVRVNAFIAGGWAEYRRKVEGAHLSLFPETPPLELIPER
jgi:hypothetical protein